MKNTSIFCSVALGIIVLAASACSTPGTTESGKELSVSGPTVLNARSEPGTIELNHDLQPNKPAEVLADVKDFKHNIKEVKLQFTHIPLEIPMENVGGSTWRASISPRELQMLAVSGKTIKYDANIIATNDEGQTAVSKSPVEVAVKSPDLSSPTG